MNSAAPMVEVEAMIHLETELAVLISMDDNRKTAVWLPKRACQFDREIKAGAIVIITLPERLATQKGLT